MPADLDSAADELYAGAREDFTPRRKELAKEAKTAGDATLATAIEKLAKPTTSAYLANQLARDPDADVDAVAELGDEFREAHANLAGADLRSLSQRRNKLVNALVARAGKLNGSPLTEGVTRELEEIFTTAIADTEVARVLIAGRLASAKDLAAAAAAWPSADPAAATGVVPRRAQKKPRKERAEGEDAELARKRDAARQELDDARSAVKEAEADRKEEERILAETQKAADAASEKVRRINEELDAAEGEEKEARRRAGSASRSVKDAERRAGQAWRLVQQAEQKLDELGK